MTIFDILNSLQELMIHEGVTTPNRVEVRTHRGSSKYYVIDSYTGEIITDFNTNGIYFKELERFKNAIRSIKKYDDETIVFEEVESEEEATTPEINEPEAVSELINREKIKPKTTGEYSELRAQEIIKTMKKLENIPVGKEEDRLLRECIKEMVEKLRSELFDLEVMYDLGYMDEALPF